MKNFSAGAINLRFIRLPLVICGFFMLAGLCAKLGFAVPHKDLGGSMVNTILSAGSFLKGGNTEVFSFMRVMPQILVSKAENSSPSTDGTILSDFPEKVVGTPEVKVNDVASSGINVKNFLKGPPSFVSNDISVLIVHTHTTESYTPSEKFNYVPSDTDRTLDKNFNMVRVGKEIEQTLKENGIKVQHDTTICDYPSYNGSYNRSGKNVQNALSNDSSIKIVLDVHRDAIEGKNGEKIKHNFTFNGREGAQVMFVVGSNLSGLSHSKWETNMQFAATLQQHILSFYPDLMRPINFRSQRFNHHLAPGAIIVEVGTNGNTLEEALYGAECFANALADYIKTN